MKTWLEKNVLLNPEALQLRKVIAFLLIIAGMMFYFAVDIWLNKIDPCNHGGRGTRCHLANLWAQLTDIPRYFADAQGWAALGLMMILIAYQGWRNR